MNGNLTIDDLRRRETTLGYTLDGIFDGVYIVDRSRRIVFWNRGAEEITGYAAAAVTGRRCSDNILNHIDAQGNLLCRRGCPLLKTIRTGQRVTARIYPLHKSGRRFSVETHIAPLRDGRGNIIAAVEVFRDVTLEEDYRRLQEKFKSTIRKYVSSSTFEEVMAQVHNGTDGLSRRRDLTVLFLDVVGFTGFSERNAPEEAVRMLNDLFGICEVITRESHGDIDKYIGDSIMAVFGDARDAVDAARKILYGALPKLNAIRRQEGREAIRVRIGINSGYVIQGNIGTVERKDLTVIGDVVNTAARIQHQSEPDSIVISESALSRLGTSFEGGFEALRRVKLKGKEAPVSLFAYRSNGGAQAPVPPESRHRSLPKRTPIAREAVPPPSL